MTVSYDRQTVNHPSPLSRFAHRDRIDRALRLAIENTRIDGSIFDFGAGPGLFLNLFRKKRPDIDLYCFEPFMKLEYTNIRNFKNIKECMSMKYSCIVCLETIEHLSDEDIDNFVNLCTMTIENDGIIIISSPIMLGPVIFIKEITRMFLFRKRSDYSLKEVIMAGFWGQNPDRPRDRGPTHKGYDFRSMYVKISSNFPEMTACVSFGPFSVLPYYFNSQAYLVLNGRHTITD